MYDIATGRNRVRLEELVGDRERWKDITAASMAGRALRNVQGKDPDDWVRQCTDYEAVEKRPRGRPGKSWKD